MADEQVIERAMELVRCAGLGLDRDGGPDLREALDLLREVTGVAGTPGTSRPAPEPDEPGLDLSGDEELPAIVERWCAHAGRPVEDFRRARREFLRGDHVPMAFPVSTVSRVACRRLRELGALPVGHRVSVVWSDDRPSVTLPVRVPVWTAVALPKRPVVLASQYLHHELGHVLELSRRPAGWPLLRRWRVPSVVTETVAIAVESLGRDAGWLAGLGVPDELAHVTAAHCRHENDYTRALAAVICRSGGLKDGQSVQRYILRVCGGLVDAEHILAERQRASYWRAVLGGHRRADVLLGDLASRWGATWAYRPQGWSWLDDLHDPGPLLERPEPERPELDRLGG